MSEMWTRLFSGSDEKLVQLLQLALVRTSRVTGDLNVIFDAARILTRREVDLIRGAMQRGFPNVNVSVTVNYPDLKSDVEQNIDAYKAVIIERLSEASPACAPFLQLTNSVWRTEDGVLTIDLASGSGVSFLKLRKADEIIRDILKDTFGISAWCSITRATSRS